MHSPMQKSNIDSFSNPLHLHKVGSDLALATGGTLCS